MLTHTKGQNTQQDDHVNADDHTATLGRCNLGQKQRSHDRQSTSSKTTEDPCKQYEPVYTRREYLHQETTRPSHDKKSPALEAAEAVYQGKREDRAECSAEDTERRDVGFPTSEARWIIFPVLGVEVEVVLEGCQADGSAEASFIITW